MDKVQGGAIGSHPLGGYRQGHVWVLIAIRIGLTEAEVPVHGARGIREGPKCLGDGAELSGEGHNSAHFPARFTRTALTPPVAPFPYSHADAPGEGWASQVQT